MGEGLRRVVAAAAVPVYTNTETSVGGGVVGGAVTSYATLGDAAAQLVLRRLADPDTNPDSRMSVTPMFVIDWRQLQRWGLREDRLPPKSQVRYKEPSIWEQYRWHMVSALLLILAQSLLVTGLLVERRHRMRTQTTLAERQEELITVNTTLSGRTDEVKMRNAQVRTLAGKLITAQEHERAHIARELHDEIGQALTIVKINLDTVRMASDTVSIRSMLDEGSTSVDQALEQVRDLSLLLRPSLLDHLGLEAALRWLVGSQAQRVGYRANLSVEKLQPPPSDDVALICYRVAQEALTNVARHASASNVWVDLRVIAGNLRLTIGDDGDGFDWPPCSSVRAKVEARDCSNLEERANLGHGDLTIASEPGHGTTLTLTVPYAGAASAGGDDT